MPGKCPILFNYSRPELKVKQVMKVYHSFEEYRPVKNPVLTVGTFDGVHFGHQKIIERVKDIARQINGETVIMTFFPHPRMIIHPEDTALKLLSTVDEKTRLLEKSGIDHLLLIPFIRDFSNPTSTEDRKSKRLNSITNAHLVCRHLLVKKKKHHNHK